MPLEIDASSPVTYQLPPPEVTAILDTPPTPVTVLSPDRRHLLLVKYDAYPPLALLARPFLKLGGIRVDPAISATQRTAVYKSLSLISVADGAVRDVTGLPTDDGELCIGVPVWARDGRRFAFTRDVADGVEVWVGDADAATCRPLPGLRVTDVILNSFHWCDDSEHLLVAQVPSHRGAAPTTPVVPEGPVMSETVGKKSRGATYQDLLQNATDEAQFAYFATAQLARVSVAGGDSAIAPLGEPDLIISVRPSPDERFLLVTRLHQPFSRRVPYQYFARSVELWDAETGRLVHTLADLPVSDEVPQQGVPIGPRAFAWQELKPATLLYVEALDGGDPVAKVPHRDRVLTVAAPSFDAEPREILRITHRFAGWDWLARPDDVLLTEYNRDLRWRTTARLNLADPENSRAVLFDLSVNDAYNDPGSPIYQRHPDGTRTIAEDADGGIYLSGRGATPEGDHPFLDRFDLATRAATRVFASEPGVYESFAGFLDPTAPASSDLLLSTQSRTAPPNLAIQDRLTGLRRALTTFADPHPQLTGLHKERIVYPRAADGVSLSGTLYLPPDYDPDSGVKLPLLFWAYPEEYSDAATAGQVRGSTDTFTRLAGTSPLWFVTQGFAVLNDATVPVVGDPETMNDTFVEQIVGAAQAAIDALDARGLIDRNRVVCAGHSYGGFMTANLLAHSDLFAAGIARSGAYNRTLTPFGFQSERRSYWEARDIYARLSPFTYADQIKSPLLLIHGQADNNPGTYTVQSERLYQALQSQGATARLVLLPHESHGYRARESVLHVLAEMFAWAHRWTA